MNNYINKKLASFFTPILYFSGIGQIVRLFYAGKGHILMFHRIIEEHGKNRIHNHHSLEVKVSHLHNIIEFYRKKKYNFISLDELYKGLKSNSLPNKFVAVTIDDGYKDNLYHALPIFKQYEIPFTVYITNSFPERTALLWWYGLEELLLEHKIVQFVFKNKKYHFDTSSIAKKEKTFNDIREIIHQMNIDEIHCFFKNYNINLKKYVKDLALNWDEIKKLSDEKLVTIGAHTLQHMSLAMQTKNIAKHEMLESKRIIEEKIKKPVHHFAYPFGKEEQATFREFKLAKEIGYLTATTTRLANVFSFHKNSLTSLPRISINALTDLKLLSLQINGVYPLIKNKFKRIVTN